MRIAVIGAPGSGKSLLADRLAVKLDMVKVDNYIEHLEDETGIAMGFLAEQVPNLMCATERIKAEYRTMQLAGENYVIAGTTVESAAYAAIRAVESFNNTDDRRATSGKIQAAMDALTLLLEHWNYDHVFYLALSQSDDDWNLRLDLSIREALAMLQIDHTPLTSDDPFEEAMKIIKSEEPVEPTTTEE